MKKTQNKWAIGSTNKQSVWSNVVTEDNEIVSSTRVCEVDSKFISPEEAEANAKLIASAPEMLEVLKIVMFVCSVESENKSHGHHPNHWSNKVINVIKKATE